jgi:alanyl-tRNA synthetase
VSRFVGYEKLNSETSVLAAERENGRLLAKLEESPFYAEGGGQVADSGVVSWEGGSARVADVYRVGEDQALALAPGDGDGEAVAGLAPGTRVEARVDHVARHATMRNHTATHLLHAALRQVLGSHVRQAGSAVRPDKLRFDFTHGAPLSAEEMREVGDLVNAWIKQSHPVRAMQMSREEAERLGAMALFGEKYGDWVRVIEVEEVSRELCGGTHVANTAEIGIFAVASEGSSAANVRRIEALTGPAGIDWFRGRSHQLSEVGRLLGSEQDPLAGARRARERLDELERREKASGREELGKLAEELASSGEEIEGIRVLAARGPGTDQKALLQLADRVKQRAGEAAIVLGGADDGKVALVAAFSAGAIERGLSAAEVIKSAAEVIGGGGGGRDDTAQAGGRDPAKLDQALAQAREAIERSLRK